MSRLLIMTPEIKNLTALGEGLEQNGFTCSISSCNEAEGMVDQQPPDLLLIEVDGQPPDSRTWEFICSMKQERNLPAIALVSEKTDSHEHKIKRTRIEKTI